MPTLSFELTTAAATRLANAFSTIPDRDGNVPAADATNAQKQAHAKLVITTMIRNTVKSQEIAQTDAELDGGIT